MNEKQPIMHRSRSAVVAGVFVAGVAVAALVGPTGVLTTAGAAVAPTTEAPTTEAPTTEAPTTQAPTTEAPTTEAPTTMPPTTEPPITIEPLEEGATLGEPSRHGCVLTVPVDVGAAGTYSLEVWDDKVQVGDVSKSFSEGESGAFTYTITQNIGTAQVGLDFVVDGPTFSDLDEINNWDFPGSDRVMQFCADSGGVADHALPADGQAKPATAVSAKPKFTG